MQKLIGIVICFGLCAIIATAGDNKDAPKIEGDWTATGGSSDGKKVPEDILTKINLTSTFKAG